MRLTLPRALGLFIVLFALSAMLQQTVTLPAGDWRPLGRLLSAGLSFVLAAGGALLLLDAAQQRPRWWLVAAALVLATAPFLVRVPAQGISPLALLHNLGGLSLALLAGLLLAGLLRRPGYLLPLLIVASLVDIYSVAMGPTRAIMGKPELLSRFLLHWPLPGSDGCRGLVGFADFAFAAFILRAAGNFGFSAPRALAGIAAGLLLGFLAVWLLPVGGLPLLPFITVTVALLLRRELLADRRNLRTAAIITGSVVVILALALTVSRFIT